MYILVVRRNKEIVFQKEYKTFEDLMKKFDSINFDKDNLNYSIYKNMAIKEIVKEYCILDKDAKRSCNWFIKCYKRTIIKYYLIGSILPLIKNYLTLALRFIIFYILSLQLMVV